MRQSVNTRAGQLRLVGSWIVVVLVSAVAIAAVIVLGWAYLTQVLLFPDWATNFAVLAGLPLAAAAALFVVVVLKASHGPMEFEALGIKLKGASGPVVLWLICFLSIAVSIRLLWGLGL